MKNKILAAILAIFFGGYGIHKFYIGNPKALLYLLFCWTGIPSIMGIVQGIKYLLMSDKEFDLLVMQERGLMGSKAVEQMQINDQLNAYSNKYASVPSPIKYELTGEFYSKLLHFSHDVLAVSELLKNNFQLLNYCSNNPGKIQDCICYDMMQIFGMLYGANFDTAKLESFSCFMLLPNANSDLIRTKSYTELANNYQSKKYEQTIKDTISYYINYDNPLLVLSGSNTALALPNALKTIDNKLFVHYTNMLYNYAKFLSIADDLATIDEQKALNQIYQIIYN
ncbi:MAG: TM2 domain-containing protein [Bacteroidetes bacterium]|nr:TM2 domain-containing protein [Bacteroidota bacterium]